jgi:hypothetical protein
MAKENSLAPVDVKAAKRSATDAGTSVLELTQIVLGISELQIKARMIDYAETPTFMYHLRFLKAARSTTTSIQFQAERANKRHLDSKAIYFKTPKPPYLRP